ncbi:MAG: HDOD domain-containing protein [bacterium]
MREEEIEKTIKNLNDLPTLPSIAIKILEVVRKEDTSLKELADIISTDPPLSAKVLTMINSSFYGLRNKVTSIQLAINLLGMNAVKNLALSFSLIKMERKSGKSSFDYSLFWRTSLLSGICAKSICARVCPTMCDDAFFLGLLHNIGILALNQSMPQKYSQVLIERQKTHREYHELEDQIIGLNHMDLGLYLIKKWGLPELFFIPIAYHHNPDHIKIDASNIEMLTRILHLTSLLVEFFSLSVKKSLIGVFESLTEKYGFGDKINPKDIAQDVNDQTQMLFPLYEIKEEHAKSYIEILNEARHIQINFSLDSLKTIEEQKRLISTLKERSSVNDYIQGSEEMILEVDQDNKIKYMNSNMAKLFNITKINTAIGSYIKNFDNSLIGNNIISSFIEITRFAGEAQIFERECLDFPPELLPGREINRPIGLTILKFIITPVNNNIHIVIQDITYRRWLENTFSRYVSPSVIKKMQCLDNSNFMKMEYKEVSILFCDLRGFTNISQMLKPDEIQQIVNSFLKRMVIAIEENEGTIDKFIGDRVMALFGAPLSQKDHVLRAFNTAINMQISHKKWMIKRKKDGKPVQSLGIGVVSGRVLIGNVGTPKRMEYTALGHWVNIASKLCDIAEGGEILTIPESQQYLENTIKSYTGKEPIPQLGFNPKGKMQLKNVDKKINVISVSYSLN